MSDIFNEVDEDLRREQFNKIWERYGALIIGVAILIVAAVGGWRLYQWYEAKQAAEAGTAFEAAITLSEQNKAAEAEAAFAKLADGSRSYRVMARLREAGEIGKRDPQAAVKIYEAIAADGAAGQSFQDVAQLRAAALLLDTASYDDVQRRLEPLTLPNRTFRHSARELLALSAWRANNEAATREWLTSTIGDPESPANLRSRAEALLALLPPAAKS